MMMLFAIGVGLISLHTLNAADGFSVLEVGCGNNCEMGGSARRKKIHSHSQFNIASVFIEGYCVVCCCVFVCVCMYICAPHSIERAAIISNAGTRGCIHKQRSLRMRKTCSKSKMHSQIAARRCNRANTRIHTARRRFRYARFKWVAVAAMAVSIPWICLYASSNNYVAYGSVPKPTYYILYLKMALICT